MAKSIKLNSGHSLPTVGLGTWKSKPGQVEAAVIAAVEAGYRHIDCAYAYQNEAEVGAALRKVFAAGTVTRADLFITSKLWNTRHAPEDVKPSLKESLTSLGLDYIDLYLIHWPISFKRGPDFFPKDELGNVIYDDVPHLKTWAAMESLVDEGLARSIGLSNFNSVQIKDILDHSRIKPAVLQVEVNLYLQQDKLIEFCQKNGIAVVAYSQFGSPDGPWAKPGDPQQLDNPELVGVAKRVGKSPGQVLLRWLVQRGVAVIPKSVTTSRIVENNQIFDFELPETEVAVIRSLNKNTRSSYPVVERNGVKEARDKDAPYFPFHVEF